MLRLTAAEARKMGLVVNKKTCRAKIKRNRPQSEVKQDGSRLMITINDVPPSLNVWHGMHWAKKAQEKRKWEELINSTLVWKRKRRQAYKRHIVRITFYFDIDRRRDKDNMTPKFLMDGLVKAGVIRDDNSKEVDLDWFISSDIHEWCMTEIVVQEG